MEYEDTLSIVYNSLNGLQWKAFASPLSSVSSYNSLFFNLSFSSNRTGFEYNYSDYPLIGSSSPSQPVELSGTNTISVNYDGIPNMMGNSTFLFTVVFACPINSSPAVVIVYYLTFTVINHFYPDLLIS